MDKAVCLDTDVCIEIIKGTSKGIQITETIAEKEVFISSISVFELYLRNFNLDKLDLFLQKVYVLDFDTITAMRSSDIDKDLKKKGKLFEIRYIFIAASCIVNNLGLATFNFKHFESINGLSLLK